MTPEALPEEALAAGAAEVFARLGGELIDPPMLMDATIPLDLSGEAVRSRLCVFQDARGAEMALRPDLTLPVALHEAQARTRADMTGERVFRYVARAFRLPAAEGFDTEFTQVGFERFGAASDVATDIETFALVLEAARFGAPSLGEASLGDLAVFPALVDAVVGDEASAATLKRRFRQDGALGLETGEQATHRAPAGLAALLAQASRDDAGALVRDMLAMAGVEPVGARSVDEIVERLLAKSGNGRPASLSPASRALLHEVLALSGPARKTTDALVRTVRKARLDGLDTVLDRLARRLDGLEAASDGLPLQFAASFGRRFTYYDGFLFEIRGTGAPALAPLAAGGRYDRLIADLSDGKADVTAIGGVVRPDRVALARGETR